MCRTYPCDYIICGRGNMAKCFAWMLEGKQGYLSVNLSAKNLEANEQMEKIADFLKQSTKNKCVFIDFSHADNTTLVLKACSRFKLPLVIGTTGQNQRQIDDIKCVSQEIPVMLESNFSLGIHLVCNALELFKQHNETYCCDIVEYHRADKADKPSGTALKIANKLTENDNIRCDTRNSKSQTVIHSIRSGNSSGQHDIYLVGKDEKIVISHTCLSREVFCTGALQSGQWLCTQQKGLFCYGDFLSSKEVAPT